MLLKPADSSTNAKIINGINLQHRLEYGHRMPVIVFENFMFSRPDKSSDNKNRSPVITKIVLKQIIATARCWTL
jgi:hypothetical protein